MTNDTTTTTTPSRKPTTTRLPAWLTKRPPSDPAYFETRDLLHKLRLQTVCEEAHCPNQGECWSHRVATVMILGPNCTRNCAFCAVPKGEPQPVDEEEPQRLASAVSELKLRHVVLTSVTRDDLPDGGAAQFARCIRALRAAVPSTTIEILTPDFQGSLETSLAAMADDLPDLWGHNLETVDRLARQVRIKANQQASLACLKMVKQTFPAVPTKSGIMLGMGETADEIKATLLLLREVGVTEITLGQYLRPTPQHHPVARFVTPEEFKQWQEVCGELGFLEIESHPYARSSYRADRLAGQSADN